VGFRKSATYGERQFHPARLYSLIRPPKNWSTRDAFVAQVRDGVGRMWWAKVTAAVRPSNRCSPNIFREHYTQALLIEDQHAVE
jgi:hypothetical protein